MQQNLIGISGQFQAKTQAKHFYIEFPPRVTADPERAHSWALWAARNRLFPKERHLKSSGMADMDLVSMIQSRVTKAIFPSTTSGA